MISEKIGQMGQVVITRGLYAASSKNKEVSSQIREAFRRYLQCDWGELDAEDKLYEQSCSGNTGLRPDTCKVYNFCGSDIYHHGV